MFAQDLKDLKEVVVATGDEQTVMKESKGATRLSKQVRTAEYYYYYTAFISRYVSHQLGNAKAHINKQTNVKSITKKFNKKGP